MLNWKPCDVPTFPPTVGRFVEVANFRHDDDRARLFDAICGERNDDLWQYIPFGPIETPDQLVAILSHMSESQGWQTLVIRSRASREVVGMSSYMRIRPEAGSAEVGAVVFGEKLKRTPAATEAMFFMARYLFDDLGYRRYEWKCDNDNVASRSAAKRLGFTFEGVFRQDMVVKGRNRDTAWFSMLDTEWSQIKAGFEEWLAPENFDSEGSQRASLADLRKRP